MLMRKTFLLLLVLCLAQLVRAQSRGVISGALIDSATLQPLSLATVTIFNAKDTTILNYRLSDPKGEFRVTGIPLNVEARMIITYSGYRSFRHTFTLDQERADLNMGTISLVNDPEALEEVVVVAERPPVIVRNDTIEFNAASFKTLPTALVEDLLRKLPGVQVDGAGNVMVNGRRVNRILVDGKAFFGDDPKMATRNLPANLIDKIQVADDKEEIDRSIDGDLSDIGKVINLSLKKGVKVGWFGKVYGGAGTDDRYEAGGIANIFRDTLQLSVLAFSNNVSKSGFSMKDVQDLGGFNRSGTNSMMIMSRGGGGGGFALNGVSFGGLDEGVVRTTGAGFNLNHAPNKRSTFFAQYFYGHTRGRLEELSNNQQFIQDTIINTQTNSNTLNLNSTHTINAGFRLKPDSLTNINLNAGFVMTENNKNIFSQLNIENNKRGPLSIAEGDRINKTNDRDYNHNFWFSRRSAQKKGRVLDISHYLSYRNNLQNLVTEQDNIFLIPVTDTVLFEQLRVQDVPTTNGSLNANYTEPLLTNLSVRVSQYLQYLRDEQLINTFEKLNGNGKYDFLNEQLSNGFYREQYISSSTVAFTYKLKSLNLTAGGNAIYQDIRNRFSKVSAGNDLSLFNILPTFSVSWKKFSLRYSERVNAPSINYMNPVPDNTNPYFIRLNNPELQPSHIRSVYGNYYNFLPKQAMNLSFYLNGSFTDDDIILSRTIDERGIQISKPVNASGSRSFQSSISVSKEFKNNPKLILSTNARLWVNASRQMLMVNNNLNRVNAMTFGPSVGVGLNFNDIVEIRPEYRISVNQTRYTDPVFRNLDILTHNIDGELIVRWPKKLVWESNLHYRTNSEVAIGMPQNNLLWNAGLTFLMLKEDKGQLKLGVYDILNRNNSYYRSATQNSIVDRRSNILQRYFLLTFTYNIRTMGAPKKVGGRERMFFF